MTVGRKLDETQEEYLEKCSKIWKMIDDGLEPDEE